MIPFTLEYFLSRSWWAWLRSVGFLYVIPSKKVILIQLGFLFIIGCYCQSDWTISRRPHHLYNFLHLTSALQTIIYSGFTLWSLACGLISTITPNSHKVELVIFMLMAGAGAGQVWVHLHPLFPLSSFIDQTLQTSTVAAQASVDRRDMSVVTAFRNVSLSSHIDKSWIPLV